MITCHERWYLTRSRNHRRISPVPADGDTLSGRRGFGAVFPCVR